MEYMDKEIKMDNGFKTNVRMEKMIFSIRLWYFKKCSYH